MLGLILLSLGIFLVCFLSVGVHWGFGVPGGTKFGTTKLAESRVKQAAPEQGCPNRESVYRQHPTLWNETEKVFTIILRQVPL